MGLKLEIKVKVGMDTFINKVEASGIITVDLLDYEPKEKSFFLDIKPFLFMEMIVKEKEFKAALETYDWLSLKGRSVAVGCSVDTIIPTWAYMLLVNNLMGIATHIDFCSAAALDRLLWRDAVLATDFSYLTGEKVVVRARPNLDPSLYMAAAEKLKPVVKTLLYGEAGMPKVIAKN
ncbi:DUF2480 family protein [Sphingobacterium psychroaquaticum]|nr:DUF2480 family protein [Sphingobacterium psychroaquaticum]